MTEGLDVVHPGHSEDVRPVKVRRAVFGSEIGPILNACTAATTDAASATAVAGVTELRKRLAICVGDGCVHSVLPVHEASLQSIVVARSEAGLGVDIGVALVGASVIGACVVLVDAGVEVIRGRGWLTGDAVDSRCLL